MTALIFSGSAKDFVTALIFSGSAKDIVTALIISGSAKDIVVRALVAQLVKALAHAFLPSWRGRGFESRRVQLGATTVL